VLLVQSGTNEVCSQHSDRYFDTFQVARAFLLSEHQNAADYSWHAYHFEIVEVKEAYRARVEWHIEPVAIA